MPRRQQPTYYENLKNRLLNHKWIAIPVFGFVVLVAVGAAFGQLKEPVCEVAQIFGQCVDEHGPDINSIEASYDLGYDGVLADFAAGAQKEYEIQLPDLPIDLVARVKSTLNFLDIKAEFPPKHVETSNIPGEGTIDQFRVEIRPKLARKGC